MNYTARTSDNRTWQISAPNGDVVATITGVPHYSFTLLDIIDKIVDDGQIPCDCEDEEEMGEQIHSQV